MDKVKLILKELKRLFPNVRTALNHADMWQLMVSVILSAQTTDKQVNKVTEKLFKKYRNLNDYIKAKPREFEKDISSVNFYKNKAKNILASARVVKKKFKGKVPKTMGELLTLKGVGRKTANIVLSEGYGLLEGIAVDTHVRRLVKRLGLSANNDPKKIEQDLVKIIPRKEWRNFSLQLIEYGRKYCPARPHKHEKCPLRRLESRK